MKLLKFNQSGVTHILAPLLFIVIFAIVGSYVLIKGHAQTPTGKTSCTYNTPNVTIQNTYQYATWGSWGTPGQKLTYVLLASNYDQNCGSSTFTVNLSAPAGFNVSTPSSTITLNSSGYVRLNVDVTSPVSITDGDYPLTASITRTANGSVGTGFTSHYKVYSSDTVAPTLYYNSPSDGQVLSAKGKGSSSVNVVVYSRDDHAVKMVQTYIDGSLLNTTNCDDTAYSCPSQYSWSVHGATGAHTITWKSYDWFGNIGTLSANFTVN